MWPPLTRGWRRGSGRGTPPFMPRCEREHWNVVARGFDKFFNHGDHLAAPIDWSTAKVQAKEDGSLCVLYHYNSDWHVATSGSPDASGNVYDNPLTFADLFWRVFFAM